MISVDDAVNFVSRLVRGGISLWKEVNHQARDLRPSNGSRETNNIVERLHETVKERTRPMRGFKNEDSARAILKGYVVNYNFARPHLSLKGKTPAEQAGIEVKGWKALIENAIQQEALEQEPRERTAVAPLQVVRQ